MAMPDLQQYPLNLNLINFLASIVFSFDSFPIDSEARNVTFTEKPQMKINSFGKQNMDIHLVYA